METETTSKVRIADITPTGLRDLPDGEILSLHFRLHQLWGNRKPGEAIENKYVHPHVFVVQEMLRRGFKHRRTSSLDEVSEPFLKDSRGGDWLQERLSGAQDAVLVPAYISVVGSAADPDASPKDIDVLIREDGKLLSQGWRESAWLLTRKLIDPNKSGPPLHMLANPCGPHLADGQSYVPLYDLVLRPRRAVERCSKSALKVDLGAGSSREDGWTSLDKLTGSDIQHDMETPLPFPDNSVAEFRAVHSLEHVAHLEPLLREVHRALVPGGTITIVVPSTHGDGAFAHPGHKSFLNDKSFLFWTDAKYLEDRPRFDLVDLEEKDFGGGKVDLRAVLRKPTAVEKRALAPIVRFEQPKPEQKEFASTDAFDPEELWPWVEKRLAGGVVAEPKDNGFHGTLQKKDDRIAIFFEGSAQDRYPALLGADAAFGTLSILPDCILDVAIGVRESDRRWPRPRLATLNADAPVIPSGARLEIVALDVLYWDTAGSVNERPLSERLEILRGALGRLRRVKIQVLPRVRIRDRQDLQRAWRTLARRDGSEGLMLKDLAWRYQPGPATSGMAKIKFTVELKALVLEIQRTKDGRFNLRGGLLPGALQDRLDNTVSFQGRKYVDLGFSFNAPFSASPGQIGTFAVEELNWDEPDRRLNWLGARPIDIDSTRRSPYFAAQAIDLARRGRVLAVEPVRKQEVPPGEGDETRTEAAIRNWDNHWQEAMPLKGSNKGILHAHWIGLAEAEKDLGMEALLDTTHALHFDLRLGTDRFDGWFGFALFAGKARENKPELKVFQVQKNPELDLRAALKQPGPMPWLKVGLRSPLVAPPGGVGAFAKTWAKFFAIDHGDWKLGYARLHAVEVFLDFQRLKGRFLLQFARLAGERVWLFNRPADQRPFAATHDLEDVVADLKGKKQRWLFWPKDPDDLSRGHEQIDVSSFRAKKFLAATALSR